MPLRVTPLSFSFVCVGAICAADTVSAEPWIHPACCPEINCRTSDQREITATADGFKVQGVRDIIRFSDERLFVSRDGQFHLCSLAVPGIELRSDQDVIEIKCLFVPLGS